MIICRGVTGFQPSIVTVAAIARIRTHHNALTQWDPMKKGEDFSSCSDTTVTGSLQSFKKCLL